MNAKEKIAALKNVSIFSSLDDDSLAKIAEISFQKKFKKGEVIFRKDEPGNVLFILVLGSVKISIYDDKGNELILKILYADDFFGEMSLLDGFFRSATVTPLEKTKALTINRKNFSKLVRKFPKLALGMLAVMCRRQKMADDKLIKMVFFDAYKKVSVTLNKLASKLGRRENGVLQFDLPFSREELASMAGVKRETLTRVLKEFKFRGILKMERKKVTILEERILSAEIDRKTFK